MATQTFVRMHVRTHIQITHVPPPPPTHASVCVPTRMCTHPQTPSTSHTTRLTQIDKNITISPPNCGPPARSKNKGGRGEELDRSNSLKAQ